MNESFFKVAVSALKADGKIAIAKILESRGSTPGKKGHLMLIRENGLCSGTVGGGKLELHCAEAGRLAISQAKGYRETLKLGVEGDFDLEMACSGEVEVEYGFFTDNDVDNSRLRAFAGVDDPSPRLVVIGAGHVSQSLGPLMRDAGFDVIIADNRPEFANSRVHPEAKECVVVDYGNISKTLELLPGDYVAIMTQGHVGDIDALRECLMRPDLKYIGLIGSAKKVAYAMDALRGRGVGEEALGSVYAPIGIKNGGRSACEIAISIACQIIAVRYGRISREWLYGASSPSGNISPYGASSPYGIGPND